jgi:NTE family protein
MSLINKLLSGLFVVFLINGCTNTAQVKNQQLSSPEDGQRYSLHTRKKASDYDELSIILTFSGGGTRAAALAYGVMQELRDTNINTGGNTENLLDQVDHISSVSGGSFTAAYYGLHGEGLFETFENDFLRVNFDKPLGFMLLNPGVWMTKKSRTDKAIEIFDKKIFHGATFSDMMQPGRPIIIINTTDIAYGIRFSFVQEYFDLLCSDLSSFPVARAVTASSAVPVLFEPVVLENFSGCGNEDPFKSLSERAAELASEGKPPSYLVTQLNTYSDKENRKYIHFLDGGLVDNLGLRALSDTLEFHGGAASYYNDEDRQPPRRLVVIEVNASTHSHRDMDKSPDEPHIGQVMGAVTSLQILRVDADSTNIIETIMDNWAQQLSTPENPVSSYLVQVDLTGSETSKNILKDRLPAGFANSIPTNYSLKDKQVDGLILAGRHLLRENPVFKALLSDLKKP